MVQHSCCRSTFGGSILRHHQNGIVRNLVTISTLPYHTLWDNFTQTHSNSFQLSFFLRQDNIIMLSDSYKADLSQLRAHSVSPAVGFWMEDAPFVWIRQVSHYRQYPPGTQYACNSGLHYVAFLATVKTRCRSLNFRCTVISRAVDATERVGLKFASSAMSLALHLYL